MPGRIAKFFKLIGLDHAVFYVVSGRGWGLLSGPVTILLIGFFLTPEAQGYYFTFSSVMAFQVLLELGFGQCILQFASHEFGQLSEGPDGTFVGDRRSTSRLISLARLAMKVYGVIAILGPVTVGALGSLFFSQHGNTGIEWLTPWWMFCISYIGNLVLLPAWSFLEGCNQVSFVARCRLTAAIFGSFALWAGLIFRVGLFAPALSGATAFVVGITLLWRHKKPLIRQILHGKVIERISWRREIWPFHWRMAVSGVSGSISANLFNPVIFNTNGAVAAGQFGMSLSLINSVSAISMSWMYTKAASYGMLISKKRYRELDILAFRSTAQACCVCISGIVAMIIGIFILKKYFLLGDRFAPISVSLLLAGTALINQIIYGQAYYLRAHKKEPFMLLSLLGSLAAIVALVLGARLFGLNGAAGGYFIVGVFSSLIATWIFIRRRKEWHEAVVVLQ